MVSNVHNVQRMEFISKHTTTFPQTNPPKTTTQES